MSMHLSINLKCTGDPITAISEALKLAVALNRSQNLYFKNVGKFGLSLDIDPKSHVQDLIVIYQVKTKLIELEEKLNTDCADNKK